MSRHTQLCRQQQLTASKAKTNAKGNSKAVLDEACTTSKTQASKSCPIHVDLKSTQWGRVPNDLQNVLGLSQTTIHLKSQQSQKLINKTLHCASCSESTSWIDLQTKARASKNSPTSPKCNMIAKQPDYLENENNDSLPKSLKMSTKWDLHRLYLKIQNRPTKVKMMSKSREHCILQTPHKRTHRKEVPQILLSNRTKSIAGRENEAPGTQSIISWQLVV